MDRQELEELAEMRVDELKEVLPTLDETEAYDLRDIIRGEITKIRVQLEHPVRHHPDGSEYTPGEDEAWRRSARIALRWRRLALTMVDAHRGRLGYRRRAELDAKAERYRTVSLSGTMGVVEALYEIAAAAVPCEARTEQQRVVLRAARQILDNAKAKAVGA